MRKISNKNGASFSDFFFSKKKGISDVALDAIFGSPKLRSNTMSFASELRTVLSFFEARLHLLARFYGASNEKIWNCHGCQDKKGIRVWSGIIK